MPDAPPSLPLYEIPYLRLFPWLRLFRCPGSAADPKRLVLAAVGILLLQVGWAGLDRVFPRPANAPGSANFPEPSGWLGELSFRRASHILWSSESPEKTRVWTDTPWELDREDSWWAFSRRLQEPLWCVTAPFVRAFDPATPARPFGHSALAGLWALLVFGLVGGAISRVAVVALTRGERVGVVEAVRFSASKAVSLLGAPLVPMLGVVAVAALVALLGLLYRLPGSTGAVVAGALAFLPLVGGVVLTLIVVGLAAGWPLMHASVAAEAEDGFDAMSRAYAYAHQRPWHYAAYVAVAVVAGCAGLFFVDLFAALVVRLSAWALAFGGPGATVRAYYLAPSRPPDVPTALTAATAAHAFWLSVVGLLARGWVYSYFWTAATTIYLLLRRDVDGTPWGQIAYESRPSPLNEAAADPTTAPYAASDPVAAPETGDAGPVSQV